MNNWQEDLLCAFQDAQSSTEAFAAAQLAAAQLGFEHCAYGLRLNLPVTRPQTLLFNNYPAAWQAHYVASGYLEADPSIAKGRLGEEPHTWQELATHAAHPIWEDARAHGLAHGWFQSQLEQAGGGGMLTLVRGAEALSATELRCQSLRWRWLTSVTHHTMRRLLQETACGGGQTPLTAREIEVLKWMADGKTNGEISDILLISENTVKFHVKNVVSKMHVANKTAAVVRAAMSGWLS